MPPFGTPDPDILAFCEKSDRLLVTLDRASMPAHIAEHLAAGGHTAGVLLVTPGCSFRQLLDDLLLIWSDVGPVPPAAERHPTSIEKAGRTGPTKLQNSSRGEWLPSGVSSSFNTVE